MIGRQRHAAIDGRRARSQAEVEIARVIQLLHRRRILRVELRHVHEDVVIHQDAVAVLSGRLGVFGQRRESAGLELARCDRVR